MNIDVLSKSQFDYAREHYAIRSDSRLPAKFTWSNFVKIPSQENMSDCGRSVAKLGLRVQGKKYPEMVDFRKIVNTGRTGIDMYDLELAMKLLGIECASYVNVSAHTIMGELARSKDIWAFSHQMLGGTHGQYLRMESGHYAVAVYTTSKHIITTDSGIRSPGWGQITPYVYDRITHDTKIVDPTEVIVGWAMRIGVSNFLADLL